MEVTVKFKEGLLSILKIDENTEGRRLIWGYDKNCICFDGVILSDHLQTCLDKLKVVEEAKVPYKYHAVGDGAYARKTLTGGLKIKAPKGLKSTFSKEEYKTIKEYMLSEDYEPIETLMGYTGKMLKNAIQRAG